MSNLYTPTPISEEAILNVDDFLTEQDMYPTMHLLPIYEDDQYELFLDRFEDRRVKSC